jgi:hypothetical protein
MLNLPLVSVLLLLGRGHNHEDIGSEVRSQSVHGTVSYPQKIMELYRGRGLAKETPVLVWRQLQIATTAPSLNRMFQSLPVLKRAKRFPASGKFENFALIPEGQTLR